MPEDEDDGQGALELETPDDLVQFYDPTDVFGDLADSLAERFPRSPPDEDETDDEGDDSDRRLSTPPTVDAPCAWSGPSSSKVGRSCPGSGSRRTPRPWLAASGARAGQFVHVRTPDYCGPRPAPALQHQHRGPRPRGR